jgi:hypothetical protein
MRFVDWSTHVAVAVLGAQHGPQVTRDLLPVLPTGVPEAVAQHMDDADSCGQPRSF